MKIAFLSFYSGHVNRGVETFTHELANRLRDLGNDVTVYQNGPKLPGTRYNCVAIGVKVDWRKKGSYVSFVNYYALRVREFSLKVLEGIDNKTEIIFPTNGQWESLLCSIWSKRHKARLIISGQSGPGFDDRLNLWFFPDRFVALTQHQAHWAKLVNPFVRTEVIPNGVDISRFKKGVPGLKIDLPKPIILNVGAFDLWKRQYLAIKAVSKLDKGSLLLVGKGKSEQYYQELGEKYLSGRFKIMSFSHDKMPLVYSSCDIFTYPTVPWESFGIAMVEAMASGLPVVVNDDPIRCEIVGNAGLFVDPTDTNAYADALSQALKTNWGDKPRKQAEKFSWDAIAKEYDKLFKSL